MLQESEWCINTLPAHAVPLEMYLFPPFLSLFPLPLLSLHLHMLLLLPLLAADQAKACVSWKKQQ